MSEEETVTMSKTDYAKAIQSAEDKIRTTYSKKIKELEAKIPPEKSDKQKELEKRLSELESREKRITLKESLANKNLDSSLADYLKDDADVAKFGTAIDNIVNSKLAESGFKPSAHVNNAAVTKDKWAKMSYSEKQGFYQKNPDLAKKFMEK